MHENGLKDTEHTSTSTVSPEREWQRARDRDAQGSETAPGLDLIATTTLDTYIYVGLAPDWYGLIKQHSIVMAYLKSTDADDLNRS